MGQVVPKYDLTFVNLLNTIVKNIRKHNAKLPVSFVVEGILIMSKPTTGQHYVWRSYLAAWTKTNSPEGQIACLRDKKPFSVSLMKIAKENCFYGVKELSQQERDLIYEMAVRNKKGVQRDINESWLNLYCAPFDFVDRMTALGYTVLGHTDRIDIEKEQEFQNWNIEYIEKIHAKIEETGQPYITLLRQDSLDFWKDEADRDKFCFFLCNQYFRTKKTRDVIVAVFDKIKREADCFADIRAENIWLPLSLIYASDLGANIAHNYSAVLLQADNACFIVGDQPVINTYATYDMMTAPTDVELFYPVTPHSALLLTTNSKYKSGQILKISADEVRKYNVLEQRSAREMIFATDSTHLNTFSPPSN